MLQDKTKYHVYMFLSSQFLLVKSSILNTVSEDWGQCKKPHGDQGTRWYDQTGQLQLYLDLYDSANQKYPDSPYTVCLSPHLLGFMNQLVD